MSKSNFPADKMRSEEFKVRFSIPEAEKLLFRAKVFRTPVARFIREITLSDDNFQIVSPGNKAAAKRARIISDLISQLYIHRITSSENKALSITADLQSDLNQSPDNVTQEETILWRRVTDELNTLNAELLGYADDDD